MPRAAARPGRLRWAWSSWSLLQRLQDVAERTLLQRANSDAPPTGREAECPFGAQGQSGPCHRRRHKLHLGWAIAGVTRDCPGWNEVRNSRATLPDAPNAATQGPSATLSVAIAGRADAPNYPENGPCFGGASELRPEPTALLLAVGGKSSWIGTAFLRRAPDLVWRAQCDAIEASKRSLRPPLPVRTTRGSAGRGCWILATHKRAGRLAAGPPRSIQQR